MEAAMAPGEIAVLSLIVAVFVVFGATLAWVSRHWISDEPRQRRARADHTTSALVASAVAPANRKTV
jgi:hypothetical protein